jgi:hypothetical protein
MATCSLRFQLRSPLRYAWGVAMTGVDGVVLRLIRTHDFSTRPNLPIKLVMAAQAATHVMGNALC